MMDRQGSWWTGRPMPWNPDRLLIEQARQRWVYEQVSACSDLISTDPAAEYDRHREKYLATGSPRELALMLEYVTCR